MRAIDDAERAGRLNGFAATALRFAAEHAPADQLIGAGAAAAWLSARRSRPASRLRSAGESHAMDSGGSASRSMSAFRSFAPWVGHDEHLHAPVAGGRSPLDEAARLEPVDDAGDVRGVAAQRARQPPHGQRLVGLEQAQDVHLGRRELEFGRDLRAFAPARP